MPCECYNAIKEMQKQIDDLKFQLSFANDNMLVNVMIAYSIDEKLFDIICYAIENNKDFKEYVSEVKFRSSVKLSDDDHMSILMALSTDNRYQQEIRTLMQTA